MNCISEEFASYLQELPRERGIVDDMVELLEQGTPIWMLTRNDENEEPDEYMVFLPECYYILKCWVKFWPTGEPMELAFWDAYENYPENLTKVLTEEIETVNTIFFDIKGKALDVPVCAQITIDGCYIPYVLDNIDCHLSEPY